MGMGMGMKYMTRSKPQASYFVSSDAQSTFRHWRQGLSLSLSHTCMFGCDAKDPRIKWLHMYLGMKIPAPLIPPRQGRRGSVDFSSEQEECNIAPPHY